MQPQYIIPKLQSTIDRFFAKVQAEDSGCFIWTGSIGRGGYGHFRLMGRTRSAHQILIEIAHGPIPTNLECDHLCRNRACVNPSHIELVTHHENVIRGKGLAAIHAKKTHCNNGHLYTHGSTRIALCPSGFTRRCRTCEADASRRYITRKKLKTS